MPSKPKNLRYRSFKSKNDRYRIWGTLLDPCYIHETRVGKESCETPWKLLRLGGLDGQCLKTREHREAMGKKQGEDRKRKDNAESQRARRFRREGGCLTWWLEKLGIVFVEQLLERRGGALLKGVDSLD